MKTRPRRTEGTDEQVAYADIQAFNDGTGFTGCVEDPMNFEVSFHPDNGGVPDEPIFGWCDSR